MISNDVEVVVFDAVELTYNLNFYQLLVLVYHE